MVFFPNNKFLDAGFKTILLFGLAHIIVLLVAFLQTGDLSLFNIARILELNRIFPVSIDEAMQDIVSALSVALVYGIVYFRFTK